MMWLMRILNFLGLRKDELLCMRQADTWRWPDNLGRRTAGYCYKCHAPIFFEKQNRCFRKKICNRCAHGA